MNTELDNIDFSGATQKIDLNILKQRLSPLAKELFKLQTSKEDRACEFKAFEKDINKQIAEVQSKIRSIWGPYIDGAERSELDIDGLPLLAEQVLQVSVEDKDKSLAWCESNGYKDVMRWDINTNKLKSIAKEEKKEKQIEIPGISYDSFQLIKIKG